MTGTHESLPPVLPIFPLTGALLLPRGRLPLNIFEPRYLAMFEDAMAAKRMIGMIQPNDREPGGGAPRLFAVGCAGLITSFSETEDNRYVVALDGVARFRVVEELSLHRGYRRVVADWTPYEADLDGDSGTFDRSRLIRLLRSYFQLHGLTANWSAIDGAPDEQLLTSLAMICPFEASEKQALLEARCLSDRARLMMALIEIAVAHPGGEGGPLH